MTGKTRIGAIALPLFRAAIPDVPAYERALQKNGPAAISPNSLCGDHNVNKLR
jgi:hypothetical protein